MSSRLVTGGSASNSGLSRLVSFRSRPPTRHTPSLPSASSASSSSAVAPGNVELDGLVALDDFADFDVFDVFEGIGASSGGWRFGGFGGTDRGGRRDRGLARHGRRVARRIDALVGRLADLAVARPATDLGADHDLGTDPRDVLEVAAPSTTVVLRRRRVERRVVLDQRLEALEEVGPDRAGEAAADLAGEPQLAVLVHADGHRTEVPGVAAPRGPATDHQLLLRPDLDLEPRIAAAARLVPRATELRHHPLDAERAGRVEERLPLPDHVRREAHPRVVLEHASEQALAVLEGHVEQRSTVEVEQVERLVQQPVRLLVAELGLEEAEVGPAVLVDAPRPRHR